MAPAIVVAIGYPTEDQGEMAFRRLMDLTPSPSKTAIAPASATGGGDGFLRVVEEEIKPLVSAHYNVDVKSAIAEGDRVALELESGGELRNGRVYNNQYHTLLTIRAGKIAAVRESFDTQHVVATWFTP